MTDCPDWQEQVVAPGGGSIGGGITVLGSSNSPSGFVNLTGTGNSTAATATCTNAAAGYAMLAFGLNVVWEATVAASVTNVLAGGDITYVGPGPGMFPVWSDTQVAINEGHSCQAAWCGLVYLSQAAAVVDLVVQYSNWKAGSFYINPGTVAPSLMIWTP